VIDLADRPRLGNVEDAERHERERRAPPLRRRREHRDHHACNLVPDDRGMIVHPEPARALAADPHAGRDRHHGRDEVPDEAERRQHEREREPDERAERARRERCEARPEAECEQVHRISEVPQRRSQDRFAAVRRSGHNRLRAHRPPGRCADN
jgi:hypothetical protein